MSSYLNADYSTLGSDFYYSKTRNLNNSSSRYQGSSVSSNKEENLDTFVSSKGNTCTDGKDDGKIGILSVIGNTIEGVGKTALNMVKGAVQHPFKTAAVIGACCIPVVGPVIAGGLAVYGTVKGVSTVASGVSTALSATTDAEAKDAWESVGEGTFTAGASALALKGSAGQLKTQLNGGSTTVSAVKAAKANGASNGEIVGTAVREGISETASNAAGVAQASVNAAKKVINKGKGVFESAKNGNLRTDAKAAIDNFAAKAGEKAKSLYTRGEKLADGAKAKFTKSGRETAKAEKAASIQEQINNGTRIEIKGDSLPKGVTKVKGGYEITNGNIKTTYNSNGELISETVTNGNTVTVNKFRPGTRETISTSTTQGDMTTTTTYAKNGSSTVTTESKIGDTTYKNAQKIDAKGNTLSESSSSVDSTGKVKSSSSVNHTTHTRKVKHSKDAAQNNGQVLSESGTGYGSSFTGVKKVQVQKTVNGKVRNTIETQYYQNGKLIDNPTRLQKLEIIGQSTDAGIYANKIMDYEIPKLNEATNPFLQTTGSVLLENEE